jgi:peroxiredoxin
VELPRLELLWQDYRDQGFSVLAIESSRDTEVAREFIAEHDLTYTCVEDVENGESVVSDKLDINSFPNTYLVDREGRIVFAHLGFDEETEARLEEELKKLL